MKDFIGANLFLLAMLGSGLAVAALLFIGARTLGADEETLHWLSVPIGLVAVVSSYFAGKYLHRALARLF